jgi:hypothetical protein
MRGGDDGYSFQYGRVPFLLLTRMLPDWEVRDVLQIHADLPYIVLLKVSDPMR